MREWTTENKENAGKTGKLRIWKWGWYFEYVAEVEGDGRYLSIVSEQLIAGQQSLITTLSLSFSLSKERERATHVETNRGQCSKCRASQISRIEREREEQKKEGRRERERKENVTREMQRTSCRWWFTMRDTIPVRLTWKSLPCRKI